MEKKYTAMVRKSRLEYVAVCLELNVSARGSDLTLFHNLTEALHFLKKQGYPN